MFEFIGGVLAIAGAVILFLFLRFMFFLRGAAGLAELVLYVAGFVIELVLLYFALEFVMDSIGILHSKIRNTILRKKR